ncbi:MAG: TlpA disulfide reductase family protein [Actinocatenispora sp.]
MRRVVTLLTALAAVAGLAAGCSTGSDAVDQNNGGDNRYVAGNGESKTFAPDERGPAPKITGELISGGRFTLSSWRGHVTVINFWASWCNPCAAEAPDMEKVYRATRDDGVRFVGVNIRDQKDAARAFVSGRGMTYPSLFDPPGRVALAFRDFPPNTIPATVVVDRQGRVAAVLRRAVLAPELRSLVDRTVRGR